ncbi:MAG: glycosyltransferase family 2 protein [Bacteroidales bacterium]|jgi:glycosyltransferase involved in cell wall biosynthesis|nr:glycosyltransferase family 2 protein [Bacteroidales bacterium]
MSNLGICVVIPTFNNAKTVAAVIDSVLEYDFEIVVVNDGSTDNTNEILDLFREKIRIISYTINRGKGFALKCGFDYAQERGFKYALTLDSDGQHFADDIPLFVKVAQNEPDTMVVGNRNLTQDNMPKKNSFANKFSNFWFALQTGQKLPDTQSGFRLYPLEKMRRLRPITSRYEAELEMLVRCAWSGIKVISVPIRVYYASDEKRVSHFRPGVDFLRISLLNTLFTFLAVVYGYPTKFIRYLVNKSKSIFK